MSVGLLMPKATAVWLIDNTRLTFDQIAAFCSLHPLEVKAIADGEVAQGVRGVDPVSGGQLTRDELDKAENNPAYSLHLSEPKVKLPDMKKRRGAKYTPLSRRHDRPNAILWLLRNHPELVDAQISRLVGTTKSTIEQVRNRSHWNMASLTATDPVVLGLCSQVDLDFEVQRSSKNRPARPETAEEVHTLIPAHLSILPDDSTDENEDLTAEEAANDVRLANVFGTTPSATDHNTDPSSENDVDLKQVFAKLKQNHS
jgi:uncharacterized protein